MNREYDDTIIKQGKPVLTNTDKLVLSGTSTLAFGLASLVAPICYIPASVSAVAFGRVLSNMEEEAIQEKN